MLMAAMKSTARYSLPKGFIGLPSKWDIENKKLHDLKTYWGFKRGEHLFLLEPLSDNQTRFRQIERFNGPMVLLMGSMIKKPKRATIK